MSKFFIRLAVGLACGLFNLALDRFVVTFSFPLFLDTIFTAAAAFFSCSSGIIAAVSYHVILFFLFFTDSVADIGFMLCSLTVVLVIRLALRRCQKMNAVRLLIMAIILGLVISLEGSLIFTFIFKHYQYVESVRTGYLSFLFLKSNIPVLVSAFLARIPVNLVDKVVAVFAGWYVCMGVRKICGEK